MSPEPRLPQELVDLVIDELGAEIEDEGPSAASAFQALLNFSLVCQAHLEKCRSYKFKVLSFIQHDFWLSFKARVQFSAEFLAATPDLARHIRHLKFHHKPAIAQAENRRTQQPDVVASSFVEILTRLKWVEKLSFCCKGHLPFSWARLDERLTLGVYEFITRPDNRLVELEFRRWNKFPRRLLAQFPSSLKSLKVNGVELEDQSNANHSWAIGWRLKSLCISNSSSVLAAMLLPPNNSIFARLSNLDIRPFTVSQRNEHTPSLRLINEARFAIQSLKLCHGMTEHNIRMLFRHDPERRCYSIPNMPQLRSLELELYVMTLEMVQNPDGLPRAFTSWIHTFIVNQRTLRSLTIRIRWDNNLGLLMDHFVDGEQCWKTIDDLLSDPELFPRLHSVVFEFDIQGASENMQKEMRMSLFKQTEGRVKEFHLNFRKIAYIPVGNA